MYNFLTKTGVDVAEGIAISQLFTDIIKQVIIAVVVVLVNTLLYPLLKYLINKIYKKFDINKETQEDINNIIDASNEEINKVLEKEKDNHGK